MTTVNNLLRDVTCAMAAAVLTLVFSVSFVESTSAAQFYATPAVQAQNA
jgi:hypothetical protein